MKYLLSILFLLPFSLNAQNWEDSVVTTTKQVFICNVEGSPLPEGAYHEWFFSSAEYSDTTNRYTITRTSIASRQCVLTGRQESTITYYYTKPKYE